MTSSRSDLDYQGASDKRESRRARMHIHTALRDGRQTGRVRQHRHGDPVYHIGPAGQACPFMDGLFHSADGPKHSTSREPPSSLAQVMRLLILRPSPEVLRHHEHAHGALAVLEPDTGTSQRGAPGSEELQTMRTLARNMDWPIMCIDMPLQRNLPWCASHVSSQGFPRPFRLSINRTSDTGGSDCTSVRVMSDSTVHKPLIFM